jgi:uncharacterized membrane protein
MNWNNSNNSVSDRVFGALPYFLPLFDMFISGYGSPLFNAFPVLESAFVPLIPVLQLYRQLVIGIPFGAMLLFLVLYLAVVRNDRISRFVRFNVMQAILVDIILSLCNLVLPLLAKGMPVEFVTQTLVSTIFLGIIGIFGYAVVRSLRGETAMLPAISDAVNMQIR